MATGELACTCAALILFDDGIPITADKISTLAKAANVNIESFWPGLFAKLLEKKNIEDLILTAGSGQVSAAPVVLAAGATGAAPAASAEEKKEEPEAESEDEEDFSFNLFE